MSHFTTVTTQIKDIAALRSACGELGLQVLEDTTARGYSTNTIKGDYVLRLEVRTTLPSTGNRTAPMA